jgi:hypothetical protein
MRQRRITLDDAERIVSNRIILMNRGSVKEETIVCKRTWTSDKGNITIEGEFETVSRHLIDFELIFGGKPQPGRRFWFKYLLSPHGEIIEKKYRAIG